jgi:hypothetical protein
MARILSSADAAVAATAKADTANNPKTLFITPPFLGGFGRRMTARFGKSLKSALLLQVRMCSVVIKSFRHGEGYGALRQDLPSSVLRSRSAAGACLFPVQKANGGAQSKSSRFV